MKYRIQTLSFLLILSIFSLTGLQGQEIKDLVRLNELGIDLSITNNILYKSNLLYDFKMRSNSLTPKDSTNKMANYSAKNELGKRWKLISVNDSIPSPKVREDFNREYNTTIPKKEDKAIMQSIKIASESDLYIIVEYSFDPAYMSVEDYFLGKSKVSLKIDKRTKRLISAHLKSTESVIVKMWNVDSYEVKINYVYAEANSDIFVEDKAYTFNVNMLGKKGKLDFYIDYYQFLKTD